MAPTSPGQLPSPPTTGKDARAWPRRRQIAGRERRDPPEYGARRNGRLLLLPGHFDGQPARRRGGGAAGVTGDQGSGGGKGSAPAERAAQGAAQPVWSGAAGRRRRRV